jgi:hypothetical protein
MAVEGRKGGDRKEGRKEGRGSSDLLSGEKGAALAMYHCGAVAPVAKQAGKESNEGKEVRQGRREERL